ncbi:MAG: hypothetical protein ACYCXG_00230 [Acidiferrobacter sp.]
MKIIRDVVKVGQKVVGALLIVELVSFLLNSILAPTLGANAGNTSFAIAAAIVGGSYWIYRKRHPHQDNGKFGEGLRGSEVEDHTDKP